MPTINRQTVISFPLEPNTPDITTGIDAGSLYLNKVLFEKQLNYGEAHCDRFEVTLFGVDDLSDKTILVYQLDYSNDPDNPTRYDLFYGVVDSCLKEENNTNRRLVAYDLMYTVGNQDATAWWNNYWSNRATSTLGDMLENLLTYGQFVRAFNLNFLNSPTANVEVMQFAGIQSITFGTLLSYICQLLLCNPHFEGLAGGYSHLDFVFIGALYGTTYHRSTHNIDTQYVDENSHFEDYETSTVDRVVLYGETDVIAGSYGTGNNVYVIKNNPLLYNLVNTTYDALAQTIYNNFDGYEAYTPANVKMIVSDPNIILGDTITTTHGNSTVRSIVSSMEISGSLFVEQTLISSGNPLLTPDDFNLTNAGIANATNTANEALDQANTTARHFVWVPNVGAFVTTDNTPAGQAPVNNYSRLDETGLYVATQGKEVAHFGIDENNEPVSVLGSTDVGSTSVIMSEEGLLAGRQISEDQKVDYFNIKVPDTTTLYKEVQGTLTVQNNQGYLQLPTTYNYLAVSDVSYAVTNTLSGTSTYIALSQTRQNLDIALQTAFDDIFRSLKDSSLTDSSTLKQWFDALNIASVAYYGRYNAPLLSGDTVTIQFYDSSNNPTSYYNATQFTLNFGTNGVTVQDGTTLDTRERHLSSTDYSFSTSNPYQITLNNYSYFNGSVPRTVSGVTVSAQTVRFYAYMRLGEVTYNVTMGQSVDNEGVNSIVLGDSNTVTDDSQLGVIVAGRNNTVDNNRGSDSDRDCYIIGASNTIGQRRVLVFGNSNTLSGNDSLARNVVVGDSNTITHSSGSSSGLDNNVFGSVNTITSYDTTTVGTRNEVAGSENNVFGEGLKINSSTDWCTVVGRYNVAPTADQMFIIGNGSYDDDRHNVVEISDTGALTLDGQGIWVKDANSNTAIWVSRDNAGNYNSYCGVRRLDGKSQLYLASYSGGSRSIYTSNSAGTSLQLLNVDDSNNISGAIVGGWTLPKRGGAVIGSSSTNTLRFNVVGACLTSGGQQIVAFLPFPYPPSTPNITYCRVGVRPMKLTNTAAYAFFKSGTTWYSMDATDDTSKSPPTKSTLKNNNTLTSGVSSISITETQIQGFTLSINFSSPLAYNTSGTALTNNIPLSLFVELKGTWS